MIDVKMYPLRKLASSVYAMYGVTCDGLGVYLELNESGEHYAAEFLDGALFPVLSFSAPAQVTRLLPNQFPMYDPHLDGNVRLSTTTLSRHSSNTLLVCGSQNGSTGFSTGVGYTSDNVEVGVGAYNFAVSQSFKNGDNYKLIPSAFPFQSSFGYRGNESFYPSTNYGCAGMVDGTMFSAMPDGYSDSFGYRIATCILDTNANATFYSEKNSLGNRVAGKLCKSSFSLVTPVPGNYINYTDTLSVGNILNNTFQGINCFIVMGYDVANNNEPIPPDLIEDIYIYTRMLFDTENGKTDSIYYIKGGTTNINACFNVTRFTDGTYGSAFYPFTPLFHNNRQQIPANKGLPERYFNASGFFARYNFRGYATQYFKPSLPVGPAGTTLAAPRFMWPHPDGYYLTMNQDTQHTNDFYFNIAGYGFYNAQSCSNWARGVPLTGVSPIDTNSIGYLKA